MHKVAAEDEAVMKDRMGELIFTGCNEFMLFIGQ